MRPERKATQVALAGALALAALATVAGWNLLAARPALPLRMPISGLAPADIRSSFGAPRDGGRRRHHGADLFASRGTPVCAATSGLVVFVGRSRLGGKVVYVAGEGLVTYYAHLDEWAPGLRAGRRVARGTRLGRVGDSGNARGTPCHLHFAVHRARGWLRPEDPVPLLVGDAAARRTS